MMPHKNIDFASLTSDQLTAIERFEKEFNAKYGNSFYIMALDNK